MEPVLVGRGCKFVAAHLSFGDDRGLVPSALTNENRFFPEHFTRLPMSHRLLWCDDKVGVWKKKP